MQCLCEVGEVNNFARTQMYCRLVGVWIGNSRSRKKCLVQLTIRLQFRYSRLLVGCQGRLGGVGLSVAMAD